MASQQEGNTLIPSLMLNNAAKAIELYKSAFGAKEMYRMEMPGSDKIMHACIEIGNTKVFLSDPFPEMGCGTTSVSTFYLYLDDVDAAYKTAKGAGMKEVMSPQDMFWGDRTGSIEDEFGIRWTVATHVRDVSPEEMEKARKQWGKAA